MPTTKLSDKETALLARRLAYAYEGGITLKRAFELMLEENPGHNLKMLAHDILNAVKSGYSLEEALRAQCATLDGFFIDLVAAGEQTGRLSEVFDVLNGWYEEQLAFGRMLSYHFSYYLVLFAVVAFFLYPSIEVFLRGSSPMVLAEAFFRFAVVAAAICAAARLGVLSRLRQRFSARTWPLSRISKQLNLSRFCRILALTYGHLSFYASWARAAESVWDDEARRHLMRVPDRVREGATLGQAVLECKALPDMVKEMIITGENTGNTDECFLKASEYLRGEAMHRAHVLSLAIGSLIVIALMAQQALGAALLLGSILRW